MNESVSVAGAAVPASNIATGEFSDPLVVRMVEFLRRIGLAVEAADLADPTFLPGLRIESGCLLVDAARLRYPGDILHEAGHPAVAPPRRRAAMQADPG